MHPWECRGNGGAIGTVEYDSKTKHLRAVFTSGAAFQIICGIRMRTQDNGKLPDLI